MNTTEATRIPGKLTPDQYRVVEAIAAQEPNAVVKLAKTYAEVNLSVFAGCLADVAENPTEQTPRKAALSIERRIADLVSEQGTAEVKTDEQDTPSAVEVTHDFEGMGRTEVLVMAKQERKERKAWERAGSPEDQEPDTPALDYLASTDAATRKSNAAKKAHTGTGGSTRMTDDEVTEWIVAALADDESAGATKLLGQFRGAGHKCSQQRFRGLVQAAKS